MEKEEEAKEVIQEGSGDDGPAEEMSETMEEETQKTTEVEGAEGVTDEEEVEKEVKEMEEASTEVTAVNSEASSIDIKDTAGVKEETATSEKVEKVKEETVTSGKVEELQEETTTSEKVEDADEEPEVEDQEVENVETADVEETKRGEHEEVAGVKEEGRMGTAETADMEETKQGEQEEVAGMEEEGGVESAETADVEETKREQEEVAGVEEEGGANTVDVEEKQNVMDVEVNGAQSTGVEQTSEVIRADVEQERTGTVVEESTHVEEGKAGVGQPAHIGSPHPPTMPPPLNDETENNNDSDPEFFNFNDFEVVDALEEEEEEDDEDGGGDRTTYSSSQQRRRRRSRDSPQRDRSRRDSSRSRHRHRSHSRERSRRDRDDARDPRDSRDKGSSSSRSSRTSSRYKDDRGHHTHSRDKKREEERLSGRSRYRQKSPRRTHGRDDTRRRRSRSPRKDASSSASKKDGSSSTSRKESFISASYKDTSSSTQKNYGLLSSYKREPLLPTPKRESSLSTSRQDTALSPSKKEPSSSSAKEDASSSIPKEETSSSSPNKEAPLFTSSSRKETEAAGQSPNKPSNEDPSKSNSTRESQEHQGAEGLNLTPDDATEQGQTGNENQNRDKTEITEDEKVEKDSVVSEVNNTKVQPDDKTAEVKDKIDDDSKDSQGNIDPVVTSEPSNVEEQKEEVGSDSTKCEPHNLQVKSGMKSEQTNIEIQPHNKVELDSKDAASGNNKGLEPTTGDSEVKNRGLTPRDNEAETNGKEKGAKTESEPENKASEPHTNEHNKATPSKKTRGAKVKELEVSKTKPAETKEGKTGEAPTQEATENQEQGIATRTRRGRRIRTPVVAVRRSTRSRKKAEEAKEEASKEVEKVASETSKTASVEQITKEQGMEESDKNASSPYSNRKPKPAEDVNADSKEKSSIMQQENEEPDLTPQDDSQNINIQTIHREDTHTTQDQDEAGMKEGKTQSEEEGTQGHIYQDSMQENSPQINQAEENDLRATQCNIIDEKLAQEKEKEELTSSKDGGGKDDTDSVTTQEDKGNKIPHDPKAEHAEKKEELTSTKDNGDKTEVKRNKRPQDSDVESAKKKRKDTEVSNSSHEGEKAEKKGKYKEKSIKVNVSSHERNKTKEDTDREKDIPVIVSSSRKGCKTKENDKRKEKEKIEEARTVTEEEAKPPHKPLRESSSKKLGRYCKVVVVGDSRMSLLTMPDIREQLKDVAQVVVVPHLTLEGLLYVVKKEVVKEIEKQQEGCSRGVLLLCLAGLHGTLVTLQLPDECQSDGHFDMQEMVCAVSDDSLDPNFSKMLAKIKKSVQEALGKGSQVLFFPVLPVDIANYNAIQAKQHFEATGHKLPQRANIKPLDYRVLQQYKEAVFKVNGTSCPSLSLVPFNLQSASLCRRFTDEQLQDGYLPTLDLMERHILPRLQRTVSSATILRFPQVVLVGDRRLGQMVAMQQEKGVEPCTFILQEQLGLRSLTADSPVVKQLSGLSRALVFLTVSLADVTPPASTPAPDSKEKAKCRLLHDLSEAMNQFVQEARRVDQLLGSVLHHCTVITTPIPPYDTLVLTKGKAGKVGLCRHCRQTIKDVKQRVAYFCRELSQGNHLPHWHLDYVLQKFLDMQQVTSSYKAAQAQKRRSYRRGNDPERRAVIGAANAWEDYLVSLQTPKRTPLLVTITSVLQNPKHLSALLPQDKETDTARSKSSRDKEHTHSTHSTHSRSRDARRRERSSSRPRSPALDKISSPASSPVPKRHTNRDLDSISSGDISFPESPCPSSINSPENFVDSSPSHASNSEDMQGQPSTTHPSSGKRVMSVDSKDRSLSPQRWTSALDGLRAAPYQQASWERLSSTHRYPSPVPLLSIRISRSRSWSKIRNVSRRSRSRTRSRSPKETPRGRMPRNASPAWVSHSPKRPLYRRSLSRSHSPCQPLKSTSRGRRSASRGKSPVSRIRSFSRGRRSVSRGRRSASRGRRSVSRGRRSVSRGRRSVSRGKRSISRGKRSLSRGRSVSRGKGSISRRSISRGRRSISRGLRSLSRGKRSVSRSKRSVSRGRSPIPRARRSFSRGRRSVSRGRRSLSRGRRSVSRGRRSVSRGRSISKGRRSNSRGRRSLSRGRRSLSRGRRGRSSTKKEHITARFPSQQDTARENTTQDALRTLRAVHEKECEMYRNNPTIHPDIGAEYIRFCDKKTQSILALGGDPTHYNFGEEWRVFWTKRIEEIFTESWRVKMNQCLDALEAHKKPSSPPRPTRKFRHSYSPSSSSLYSSDTSHSDIQSRKKRKRRKRRRRSSSLEANKRKRKVYDTRLSPPKSYPRNWAIERSPGVSARSERYEERSPEYPRGHLSKKQERGEDQELDYPGTKIPDMTRARQKEGNVKHKERRTSSSPENVKRDGHGWRSLENRKEQVQKRQSSPLSMVQAIREAWDQNTTERQNEQSKSYYPSPPGVSENKQKEQSVRYYSSPPGMSVDKECGKARRRWHQSPSPPDHRATHSDSHHTTKHSIRDFIPVDELLHDERNVVEETREVGEPVEEDRVQPPSIIRDLWLQLSGTGKSVSTPSDSPEVMAGSEGRTHELYKEHTGRQKARARDCQARQDDPLQEVRAREGQVRQDDPTRPGQPRDLDSLLSHRASKESQEGYSSHRSDKQSITEIFRSFAADKPQSSDGTTTKPGHHEGEVSSTTTQEETTKIDIDVVNVLEVLTHLGDKLGALFAPLKLVHQRAEELRTNGTDPVVIMSDSDNKFLLQMIHEKLQGILKDGQLNIIKKVIVQEAEQRLSVLLEQQKQRSLLGDLNLSHLARRCLDMDAPTTVAYIREVLLCRGQAHPPQDHLMKLYMAVKAEQLKIVRDQHDDQAAAAAVAAFTEDLTPSQHTLLLGGRGGAGLPHAAALAEDPKPPPHKRFLGAGGTMASPHASAFAEDPKPSSRRSRTRFSGGSANIAPPHAAVFTDNPQPPSHTRFSGGGASMVPPQAPALTPSPPCTEPHTPTSHGDPLPWRAPQPQLEAARGTHRPQEPDHRWKMLDYTKETKTSSSTGSRPALPPPTLACPVSHSSTSLSWSAHPPPHILEATTPSTTLSTTHSAAHSIVHSVAHSPGTLPQAAHGEVMYRQRSPKYVSKKPIRITLPKHQPQKSFVGTFNPLGDDTDSEGY